MTEAAAAPRKGAAFRHTVEHGVERDCLVRPALSVLMEKAPSMAGLALWVGHRNAKSDTAPNGKTTFAWTDGKAIYYTPSFGKLRPTDQVGVATHEILHVALRHPQRARKLMRTIPNFRPGRFNIAADCVINEALKSKSAWLTLPSFQRELEDGSVVELRPYYLSELLDQYRKFLKATGRPVPEFPPLSAWSVEDVYRLIEKWADECRETLEEYLGISLELLDLVDMDLPEDDPSETREMREHREAKETLEWHGRLIRAQAGDRPGGILRELDGDVPRVDTPWERILQTFCLQAVQPRSRANPMRPARRWLGVTLGAGMRIPYECGIQFHAPAAKIAVLIDTSGSISQDLLHRFAGEIQAIARRTGAEIYLVVCDAEVTETKHVPSGLIDSALRELGFKGGGGTSFIPALEEAEKFRPAIAVYLTDLMGTFPQKAPPFKVVWAVPTMGNLEPPTAPFGTVIALR